MRGFSDWASVAFLSGLPEAQGIAPRFYGGDVAERFFLIEDLGEGTSLQDVLAGVDNVAARAALRTLATQMARLHAATFGKQELFEANRAGLPERDGLGCQWEARQWLENRRKILDWFKALGCAPPSGLEKCLKTIAASMPSRTDFWPSHMAIRRLQTITSQKPRRAWWILNTGLPACPVRYHGVGHFVSASSGLCQRNERVFPGGAGQGLFRRTG